MEQATTTTTQATTQSVPDTRADLIRQLAGTPEVAETRQKEAAPPNGEGNAPAAAQEPTKQDAKAERVSARIAHVNRRERELRKMEEQLRRQPKPQEPKAPTLDDLRLLARADPDRALKELGIDASYVNEFFLNGGKPTQEAQLHMVRHEVQREIAALREEQRNLRREHEQRQQAAQLDDSRHALRGFLGSDASKERFELLISDPMIDAAAEVEDLIVTSYSEQVAKGVERPSVPTFEEAAQMLEDHLQDRARAWAGTKKLRGILSPNGDAAKGGQEATAAAQPMKQEQAPTDDPLEAAIRRRMEEMSGGVQGDDPTPETGVAVTQGHMQRVPDRTSDTSYDEARLGLLRQLAGQEG